MPNIRHEILIEAPVEKIYKAITSQEGLSAWWTPGAQAEPKYNSVARFGFGPEYFKEMKITAIVLFELVRWDCIAGADEWIGTTISFHLQAGDPTSLLLLHPELKDQIQQQDASGPCTVLIFHHEEWKEYTPMFAECNYTWARFLGSLKLFCETGTGCPWPGQHLLEH